MKLRQQLLVKLKKFRQSKAWININIILWINSYKGHSYYVISKPGWHWLYFKFATKAAPVYWTQQTLAPIWIANLVFLIWLIYFWINLWRKQLSSRKPFLYKTIKSSNTNLIILNLFFLFRRAIEAWNVGSTYLNPIHNAKSTPQPIQHCIGFSCWWTDRVQSIPNKTG